MARLLRRVSLALMVLFAGYVGISLFAAARISAPDRRPMESTPAEVGLDFREVGLESSDGVRLSAWWLPARDSPNTAVLVHGWGGNKSNEHVIETARIYGEAGYNVLIPDLRGHGASEPARRTLGYREARDVRAALGWLEKQNLEPEDTVLHGWSMGGATVLRAAPGSGVAAVVEEAAYADLPLLLRTTLPENSGLPTFFYPGAMLASKVFLDVDLWSVLPEEDARDLSGEGVPLFIIHSTGDGVIPFKHARRLRAAHPESRLWKLEGYEHVEAHTHPEYRERLLDFLDEAEEAA